MADNAEASGDAQITFKVKTSGDGNHVITISEAVTVLDLKTKLSGPDYENIPVERQRLIYSGRVMKNDDALSTYKIKNNNTIHMVKSAASNTNQAASTSSPAVPQAPQNMASGTANNPLAGLTGARYAGHQINMPGLDMFGPDGGMGPPMDDERMQRMMTDPAFQQQMNEALSNPEIVDMIINSNPYFRNVPNAREILNSPMMRQMLANPQLMGQAMRMQRAMQGGGGSAFPAPGSTDNSSDTATYGGSDQGDNANAQNPGDFGNILQQLRTLNALGGFGGAAPGAQAGTGNTAGQGTTETPGAAQTGGANPRSGGANTSSPPPANPFAALFGAPPGGAGGAGGAGGDQNNPFGVNPEMMQQMMQMLGGGGLGGGLGGGSPAPVDNRPPEERYEEQLRQLNDMGFFDFDRNVAALRRSGGSVQGAIEHLLSGN